MTSLDDIASTINIDQLATRLGVDRATAERAVAAALPALVGGLHANAQDPAGAASLAGAIGTKDPALVEGGVDLDQVDTGDGAKIVRNVFGSNQDQVVQALASDSRTPDASIIAKVLPLLAPIVLSFLAKQMGGRSGSGGGASSGGGLTDLLGGLLGGGGGAPGGGSGGGGLGGMLGGLLGGGSGGGLDVGGLLGGLLGGGKR
ncbi:DUF937 domain-containing protein [Cellulomonas sp.]|uniref:DUF937 domain-containing protein n=1 Tax=Cellulomonas sp. TaxID=40001 RepID=UPI001B049DE0|nr:DUF937 domain-containing protein [Cellulomonas sp.]MBO9554283.1 DUF937 domain-containing protein [Cellulomonas sp.]